MKASTSIEDLQLLSESTVERPFSSFWDWNLLPNEQYLSPRFKEIFGYLDIEMKNTHEAWQRIAFEEDLTGLFESFDKHIKSKGKTPFDSVVRCYHKNGSTVWIRCIGAVVNWGCNGKPIRAIVWHIDVTEEKELEIQHKKLLKENEILLKEVHHRVKNNLQLLLSLARLKDKNGKIEVDEIEDTTKSIAIAYESIIRSENLDEISIKMYIIQITQHIKLAQNIEFNIESDVYTESIDFLIPLGLIIMELINNSKKHSRLNSETIKVDVNMQKTDDMLNLTYCDNRVGYGENISSILEINTSRESIIEALVSQLDGSIEFFDTKGACVRINLNL
jgi:PAS domain S-box-containing protein